MDVVFYALILVAEGGLRIPNEDLGFTIFAAYSWGVYTSI